MAISDILRLNESVKEFRTLIEGNTRRTEEQERTKFAKQQAADDALVDKIKKLEDAIKDAGKDAKKSDISQLALLREEQTDRASEKVRQQELKALAQKTLGLDSERLKEQKIANEEAKVARSQLEGLKAQLQSQGIDIKSNKNFQKLELEVEKKERTARLKAMPIASSLKEQAKDTATATAKVFGKFLGPNSFFGKRIGGLFGLLNRKIISPFSGGIIAALKGGAFVLGLLALVEFLESDLWSNLKDKILPTIRQKLKDGLNAIDEIIEAFIGEEGSFTKGFEKTTEKLFGEDSRIKKVLDNVLLPALKFIGGTLLAIANIVDPPRNDDGSMKSRLQVIKENFGKLSLAVLLVGTLLAPSLMFRGLTVISFFAISKLYGAFSGLGTRIATLAGLIDGVKVPGVPSPKATTVPSGVVKEAFRGKEAAKLGKTLSGLDNVKLPNIGVSGATSKVPQVGSLGGGGAGPGARPLIGGSLDAMATQVFAKLPKFALLRALPVIGTALTGYAAMSILFDAIQTGNYRAAIPQLVGLGATVAGTSVATTIALGTLLGGAAGAPTGPGAILTGIGGGILAGFALGTLLQAVLEYSMDLPITAFPFPFGGINKLLNSSLGLGGASFTANDQMNLNDAIMSTDLPENTSAAAQIQSQIRGQQDFENLVTGVKQQFKMKFPDVNVDDPTFDISSTIPVNGKLPSGAVSSNAVSPVESIQLAGGGNNVSVAPVITSSSKVENIQQSIIRQLNRGDIFSNNALLNLGATAVG